MPRAFKRSTYWLAAAMFCAATFSATPAIGEIVEYIESTRGRGTMFIARWALVVLFLTAVQLAYGLYLLQLPDWSSVRVVTAVLLTVAALYAMGLAILLAAKPDGWLVGDAGLQLTDERVDGRAALWCLCMVSLWTMLAFIAGRLAGSWRRTELCRSNLLR